VGFPRRLLTWTRALHFLVGTALHFLIGIHTSQGGEAFAGGPGQAVVAVAEMATCGPGLAGLALLECTALRLGQSLDLSAGYTGHGGLLVWGTGSGLPVIPARRLALGEPPKWAKVKLRFSGPAPVVSAPRPLVESLYTKQGGALAARNPGLPGIGARISLS
jgi:hypothetical protein